MNLTAVRFTGGDSWVRFVHMGMHDMLARTDITEFALGALVGGLMLAAILHARGFRQLCVVGLASGALYALASLGVEGLVSWTEDLLAMAESHPTFFLGVAFGKFVQGVIAPPRGSR